MRAIATSLAALTGSMLVVAALVAGCPAEILVPKPRDAEPPAPEIDPYQPFVEDSGVLDALDEPIPVYDSACHRDVPPLDFDGTDPGTEYLPPPSCDGFPPARPHVPPNVGPQGSSADADLDGDASPILAGSRFCEIYRDIIHHDGDAQCQTLGCHGGDRGNNGLSMGWTIESCYGALTHFETCSSTRPLLVDPMRDGASTFSASYLPLAVEPPHGFMPPVPLPKWSHAAPLSAADIERVNAWLDRGAPFD